MGQFGAIINTFLTDVTKIPERKYLKEERRILRLDFIDVNIMTQKVRQRRGITSRCPGSRGEKQEGA